MVEAIRRHFETVLGPDVVLSDLSGDGRVDLSEMLVQTLGSGFVSRILAGSPSDEDQAQALHLLGTTITPDLSRSIAHEFTRLRLQEYGRPTAEARGYDPSRDPLATGFQYPVSSATGGPSGMDLLGSAWSDVNTPRVAPAGMEGSRGANSLGVAGVPPPAGSATSVPASTPGSIDVGASGGTYEDYLALERGSGAVAGPPPKKFGFTTVGNAGATGVTDPSAGNVLRAIQNKDGTFEPTGTVTDPDWQAWRKDPEGGRQFFTPDQHYAFDTWDDPILGPAAQARSKAAKAAYDARSAELEVKVREQALEIGDATKQLKIEAEKYGLERAKVDLEVARIRAATEPVIKLKYEAELQKMNLDLAHAEQTFPLELEDMQLRIANARAEMNDRELQRRQKQANDRWVAQTYPQMLGLFTSTKDAGPTPQYAQLAQGAGTTPDDPAAQMAWSSMANMVGAA